MVRFRNISQFPRRHRIEEPTSPADLSNRIRSERSLFLERGFAAPIVQRIINDRPCFKVSGIGSDHTGLTRVIPPHVRGDPMLTCFHTTVFSLHQIDVICL